MARRLVRWIVYGETPLGYVDGFDKESAMLVARRQFGDSVLRVQSARSAQLAEEERRTRERERLREEGW